MASAMARKRSPTASMGSCTCAGRAANVLAPAPATAAATEAAATATGSAACSGRCSDRARNAICRSTQAGLSASASAARCRASSKVTPSKVRISHDDRHSVTVTEHKPSCRTTASPESCAPKQKRKIRKASEVVNGIGCFSGRPS